MAFFSHFHECKTSHEELNVQSHPSQVHVAQVKVSSFEH